jgi:hypothetical protein
MMKLYGRGGEAGREFLRDRRAPDDILLSSTSTRLPARAR